MLIVTMRGVHASTSEHSEGKSKSSDLIVVGQRIRFFIVYVPFPLFGRLDFKVYCRQIGDDGRKLEGLPLLDMIMPDILQGSTINHISSFLSKFIMVESGLWFQYEKHSFPCEDYIELNKWGSLFSNFPRMVSIHVSSLDEDLLKKRITLPEVAYDFESTQSANISRALDVGRKLPCDSERTGVPPPPIPLDSCFEDFRHTTSQQTVHTFSQTSVDLSKRKRDVGDSRVSSHGSPSFKQTLVASIDDEDLRRKPYYLSVLTNEVTTSTSVSINAGPGLFSSFDASVTNKISLSIPCKRSKGNAMAFAVDVSQNGGSSVLETESPSEMAREPLGELPQFMESYDSDGLGFGI
jgi:hypothetical protein